MCMTAASIEITAAAQIVFLYIFGLAVSIRWNMLELKETENMSGLAWHTTKQHCIILLN